MKGSFIGLLCVSLITIALAAEEEAKKPIPPLLDFTMESLTGQEVNLAQFHGKVILIVNTASKCGNTPQYADLQALYERYKDRGLVVLGFPANDFGNQEPGTDEEIATFCRVNYGVTFPMFSKITVKGDDKAPLFKHLTEEASADLAGEINWNFEKFLVSREGRLIARFRSRVKPSSDEVVNAIEAELAR